MCKDIFLDRTSKTTYNHLAYMFSFTFIVNIHISKYKKRISAMIPHCLKRKHLRDTFFIY